MGGPGVDFVLGDDGTGYTCCWVGEEDVPELALAVEPCEVAGFEVDEEGERRTARMLERNVLSESSTSSALDNSMEESTDIGPPSNGIFKSRRILLLAPSHPATYLAMNFRLLPVLSSVAMTLAPDSSSSPFSPFQPKRTSIAGPSLHILASQASNTA